MKHLAPLLALLAITPLVTRAETPNGIRKIGEPNAFSLDDMPWEKLGDKIYRKHAFGVNGNIGLFLLEKGAFIPEHSHPNEQITHILDGRVEVTVGGVKHIVAKGGVIIIPPNARHAFIALEDTLDFDFFSPVREDWLNKSAAYFPPPAPRPLIPVATLPVRPGNVTVAPSGRVFATLHPFGAPSVQLVEITPEGAAKPFPSPAWQRADKTPATATTFDTPLGVTTDTLNRVWTINMGLNLGRTRLFAFDGATGATAFELTFPEDIAPKGSFVQDLAVDATNGVVYLADIHTPGILVVDIAGKTVRRVKAHPSFNAENTDMKIDGAVVNFGGAPARVGINPLTLSADRDTLHYGAMNGTTWYAISAKALRAGDDDAALASIRKESPKPVSDGVATDALGNHYFGNLNENGVDVFRAKTRTLEPLVRDPRLSWVDNVALSPDGHLYLSVNRLHLSPPFTGGADAASGPYFIYKVKLD